MGNCVASQSGSSKLRLSHNDPHLLRLCPVKFLAYGDREFVLK